MDELLKLLDVGLSAFVLFLGYKVVMHLAPQFLQASRDQAAATSKMAESAAGIGAVATAMQDTASAMQESARAGAETAERMSQTLERFTTQNDQDHRAFLILLRSISDQITGLPCNNRRDCGEGS